MHRQPSPLPHLHDAVLDQIAIDWEAGTATITVICVPGGPMTLACNDVTTFGLTRHQEWGPSFSINKAELRPADGAQLLWIEMQSGDEIQVTFGDYTVSAQTTRGHP